MLLLITGLIVFLGIHSVRILAPEWRAQRITSMGEGPWKGIYSLVSLVGLVLIIWGFGVARSTTGILYDPPIWLRHIALLLMLFSFISMIVFNLPAGRLKPMLKHPFLISVKTWAVAHLLANGETASVVLFGTVLAWAVWDRIAVGRRGETAPVPGPAKWDVMAVLTGAVLWLLFVWKLHIWLIGVSPIA